MSVITSVRARSLRVPLDIPTAFSSRVVHHRDHPVVEIESDDGHVGIGFCYAGNNAGSLVSSAVIELLGPRLKGQDPFRTEGIWNDMYQDSLLHGRTGSVMRALSALDIALWDRNAKASGLPLWRMLGGFYTGDVPAYASGGYYLDGKTSEMLGNELSNYVKQGFAAVKIKVGRLSLREEASRLQAAREAIGDGVHLMLDANNAWHDLESALAFARMAESFHPYWLEEPFSPDDMVNHAALSQRTTIPIATGEIEAGRWRFLDILQKGAAMILQPDAAVCGGITEFRRITATAASFGVPALVSRSSSSSCGIESECYLCRIFSGRSSS